MDPRLAVIDRRLEDIARIIAVSGGKGGVGKSVTASVMALLLSKLGYRTGLLDLDFCGPSVHTILGAKPTLPEEDRGVVPPEVHGIRFMSIVHYAGENPSPIRGVDISNATIELLAITRWGSLDFLVVDMPPGIGDATLDAVRLMKKAEFLLVTTGSKVSLAVVRRLLSMLVELKVRIIGTLENMRTKDLPSAREEMEALGVPFLGEIEFDRGLEGSIGDVEKLLRTRFAEGLEKVLGKVLSSA